MFLPSVMSMLTSFKPEEALTYAPSFGSMPLRHRPGRKRSSEKNPSLKGRKSAFPWSARPLLTGSAWWPTCGSIRRRDRAHRIRSWGNYSLIFSVRSGRARIAQYPLFNSNRGFNLEGFVAAWQEEARKAGKLVVLLNFPNNPTGYTISPSEADAMRPCSPTWRASGKNILAILDDAYFGLFFEENVHAGVALHQTPGQSTRGSLQSSWMPQPRKTSSGG